jgi:Iap family predicted aminopeptidase
MNMKKDDNNHNQGGKVAGGTGFTPLVRTVSVVLVVVLTLVTIIAAKSCQVVVEPTQGQAPSGYDRYAAVVDVKEFARALTDQIAALGDDPATGNRSAGSPAEEEAAKLIEQTMKDIGLQNVTVDEADCDGWVYQGASLAFFDLDDTVRDVTLGGYQTSIHAKNEEIPLVWLGKGTAEDFADKDVKGKLVLIEIDQQNDWRVNYPAYQAKLKGARAILAMSHMQEDIGARLVSQDIRGPADAPVLSISMTDSQALQKVIEAKGIEKDGLKEINVRFTADSQVSAESKTRNVWGEIPGKTDETILFTAHYDGYYHSYYDDASGVGLILSMAKAFIDSGYQPDKTLRFLTHGAEEWGRTDTEADWATGAYEQITNVRPEWAETIFALFNIDSGYPLQNMRSFQVSVPVEFQQFLNRSIASFGDRSTVSISYDGGLPSSEREDFVYNAAGIPTIANTGGEGDELYHRSMHHSSMDTFHDGGYSLKGAVTIDWFYGYTAMLLDELALRPMNFSARFHALLDSYTPMITQNGLVDAHLQNNVDRTKEIADSLDQMITTYNDDYREALQKEDTAQAEEMRKNALEINRRLYRTYKLIQDEFLRLDWNMTYEFGNQSLQRYIAAIDGAILALKEGMVDEGIQNLMEIQFASKAIAFDKKTCDYFIERMSTGLKGTWAEGRVTEGVCYVDDVMRILSIKSRLLNAKENAEAGDVPETEEGEAAATDADSDIDPLDYSEEVDKLDQLRGQQVEALLEIYARQSEGLSKVMDSMNAVLDMTADLR